MGLKKQFDRTLDDLWRHRSDDIRRLVSPRPGRAKKVTKSHIDGKIDAAERIARQLLLKRVFGTELRRSTTRPVRWHPKKGKGWGVDAKKQSFKRWFSARIRSNNFVYVFWAKSRCVYVGRTLHGKGRPTAHFEKYWFSPVTRIGIYVVRRPKDVPKVECLLTDRLEPSHNKIAAARRKYAAKCPVCAGAVEVRRKLKKALRLK